MKVTDYVSKGITKEIKVENNATVKIRDNYYKFSVGETKSFEHLTPEQLEEVDFTLEREILIDTVNALIDDQILDVKDSYNQ